MVQFPETLDMKEFVESNGEKPLLYNLSAVLIHRGPRATSGHFIGQKVLLIVWSQLYTVFSNV